MRESPLVVAALLLAKMAKQRQRVARPTLSNFLDQSKLPTIRREGRKWSPKNKPRT